MKKRISTKLCFFFFPNWWEIIAAEIERFSAMFQEKKQEVQTAILRVDQLSQQLEDLKKGKLNGFQSYNGKLTGPAAVELKRLYQELQVTHLGLRNDSIKTSLSFEFSFSVETSGTGNKLMDSNLIVGTKCIQYKIIF